MRNKSIAILCLIGLIIVCQSFISNQDRKITGIVQDSNKQALIGATILGEITEQTITDLDGKFSLNIGANTKRITVSYTGYDNRIVTLDNRSHYIITMNTNESLDDVVVSGNAKRKWKGPRRNKVKKGQTMYESAARPEMESKEAYYDIQNREDYEGLKENAFMSVQKSPLSTMSIDVDRASYSNMRRFINQGQLPPPDAIRVEEMINYFDYKLDGPASNKERPFATHVEVGSCAWNPDHHLMKIALQAKTVEREDIPASNFVFLIDVSGSMNQANKLPLLKSAFSLLVSQLRPEDKIAIAVYAGAAGTVLESTSGTEKTKILEAINNLRAGGSTAGAAGINLAYQIAEKNFIDGGNNRVILATDGDFNVGVSSNEKLVELIEDKREHGVFLSVMAFGQGNYQGAKMQKIAGHGNGNHNYIDNMQEAKKVMMNEFGGTLYTVAKDVKIQIEFNPAIISSYRLVGYENRILAAEDFNDDKKDAGDMGAGHSVTALYELIPVGVDSKYSKAIDDLKYQENDTRINNSKELATIKYRYKDPDEIRSIKSEEIIENSIKDKRALTDDFIWASAVAEFGMLLKNSNYKENSSYQHVIDMTEEIANSKGDIYQKEFVELVKITKALASK